VACFADINVSQGSVATYARCGGIYDIHFTANLPRNLPAKNVLNRLRFDRIIVMSLWSRVFGPPCRSEGGCYIRDRRTDGRTDGRNGVARNFRQDLRQSVAFLSVHSRSAALPSRLSLIDKNIGTSARFYA